MTLKYTLSVLLAFCLVSKLFAQCTPDPSHNHNGFSALSFPDAQTDQAYSEAVSFKTPSDTTVTMGSTTVPVHMDSVRHLQLKGLPAGFTYAFNKADPVYASDEKGCMNISGTATVSQAGNYTLWIYTMSYFKVQTISASRIDSASFDFKVVVNSCAAQPAILNLPYTDTLNSCGTSAVLKAPSWFQSYQWGNNVSTADSVQLTLGDSAKWHKCTVTDSRGCVASDSVWVRFFPRPAQEAINGNALVAAGATSVYYAAYDSTLQYYWKIIGGTSISADTSAITIKWGNTAGAGHVFLVTENSFGCFSDSADKPVAISSVGLEDRAGKNLSIYPNPASSILHIKAKVPADHVMVFDHTGRLVYEAKSKGINTIDISGLSAGIYNLVIRSAEDVYSAAFVKSE